MKTNRISQIEPMPIPPRVIVGKIPKRYAVVLSYIGGRHVIAASFLTLDEAAKMADDYNKLNAKADGNVPVASVHKMKCKVKTTSVPDLLV